MTLMVESTRIYTALGVPITVTGVAQVKIMGTNSTMLADACEMFLGMNEAQISDVAKNTLEGHQRAIMGNMTVEEIYKDRKKFSAAVFEVASTDLVKMGISVVSYTLKDIRDDEGYLKALGKPRTAQVKAAGRMGEAEAQMESGIKEATAEKEKLNSTLKNDEEMALAKRDFEVTNAGYDREINARKAESELAYSLQAAKTKQRIKEEEMQVKVVERTQQIQVQELEIKRKERSLEASVKKAAEAEAYRLSTIAEADKRQKIKESEAQAEAVRLRGDAEAFAITAKAKAEAEQMSKKAEALKEYQKAAKLDLVLKALPQIAAEIAQPLSQAKKIKMVSSGGEHSKVGASKITAEVIDIMNLLPHLVKNMTGVDVSKELKTPN